ncbi:hypothetical protein HDK90DRAFT_472903 [Phyllosticta capitalensis]|uniref:Uncharacterized protein n=1 Tax=Phyllosticta capitalensis TaxID=121624 RepID=A0ABR1Z381_9PEZI
MHGPLSLGPCVCQVAACRLHLALSCAAAVTTAAWSLLDLWRPLVSSPWIPHLLSNPYRQLGLPTLVDTPSRASPAEYGRAPTSIAPLCFGTRLKYSLPRRSRRIWARTPLHHPPVFGIRRFGAWLRGHSLIKDAPPEHPPQIPPPARFPPNMGEHPSPSSFCVWHPLIGALTREHPLIKDAPPEHPP